MPLIPFDDLPDDARLWVFASDQPLGDDAADRLLDAVDRFLAAWRAHGAPLACGRDWRDDRFLAIGVDERSAGASGCSIDGLYRSLRELEPVIGASLLRGGSVHYRDAGGVVRSVDRGTFAQLAATGAVGPETLVYDTTVADVGEWRRKFETAAAGSWHARLMAR